MTAAANAKHRAAKAKKIRQFVTPEGVDLELRIASAGLRFGALLVDLILIALALFLFSLFMLWVGLASRSDVTVVVWMLGAFVLRTFWFVGFELGWDHARVEAAASRYLELVRATRAEHRRLISAAAAAE